MEAGIDHPRNAYEAKSNVEHYKKILSTLPNKKLVCLELGFGLGYFALVLKKLLGYKVYGIDHPSRKFVKEKNFKKFVKKEKFIIKYRDILKEKFDFPDNFFNIITFVEVIEHLEPDKLDHMFREIRRVTKHKGLLLITTPNRSRLAKKATLFSGRGTINQYGKTHGHIKEYSMDELKLLLLRYGFRPVKTARSNFSYLNPVIDAINEAVCFFLPSQSNDLVVVAQNFKKR